MAVFTPVTEDQLKQFLQAYALGEVQDLRGIDSGIENTNYFLTTRDNEYVLTLFERLTPAQLPYYLDLMHHLADLGVACPNPLPASDGRAWRTLNGKPAAIVTRLPGEAEMQPGAAHCAAVGKAVAEMHLAARSFKSEQPNLRGLDWWRETVPGLLPRLTPRTRDVLEQEMAVQSTFARSAAYRELPAGAVHADMFRDNILFVDKPDGPQVGGIIDFYFAGHDTWIFDLAVTVNDWCTRDSDCSFDDDRLHAMLHAYQQIRPVSRSEQSAWPYALRAAALRFWISRLHDAFAPRPAEMIIPKDPGHFEQMLLSRRQDALHSGQTLTQTQN